MKARVKSFEEIKKTLDELGTSRWNTVPFTSAVWGKCGQEVHVENISRCREIYRESNQFGLMFDGEWLEFPTEIKEVEDFKNDPDTITITVRTDDREFAHRCLDDAIDEYERRHEWTPAEIERAKDKVCSLLIRAYEKSLCPVFYKKYGLDKSPYVECKISFGTFGKDKGSTFAIPKGKDKFNWDIGRCIALCKAMGKPVPDFIKNKNKN